LRYQPIPLSPDEMNHNQPAQDTRSEMAHATASGNERQMDSDQAQSDPAQPALRGA
jgi:hypothetical protein